MTIGWAMIGTGRVHRWIAPALKQAWDTRLVAVLSRDKARAVAFAEDHGIERTIDTLKEACTKWRTTKRKDGSGYYSVTNMGWVDWAQDALIATRPVEEDVSQMSNEEVRAYLRSLARKKST